jgi:hypothetical protein
MAYGEQRVLVIRLSLGRSRTKARKPHVSSEASDYAEPRTELSSELVIPVGMVFEEVKKRIQGFKQ